MNTIIILWIIVGFYLGFVCAHSMAQTEISYFRGVCHYKNFIRGYIILPISMALFGLIGLLFVLQVSLTWKIHWNPFKWVKDHKS
jgi:hypothetical protein